MSYICMPDDISCHNKIIKTHHSRIMIKIFHSTVTKERDKK